MYRDILKAIIGKAGRSYFSIVSAIVNAGMILLLGKIIQFILLLVLAARLLPEEFGSLMAALAVAQFLGLVAIPGGQQGLTASLSRMLESNNVNGCRWLLFQSMKRFVVVSILTFFCLYMFVYCRGELPGVGILLIIFVSLFSILRMSITRGLGYIFGSLFFYEIGAPLSMLLIISMTSESWSLFSVSLLWMSVYGVSEILSIYSCRKNIFKVIQVGSNINISPNEEMLEIYKIQTANFLHFLFTRLDIIILALFAGTALTGAYALVKRVVEPITIITRVLANSTAPMVARFYESTRFDLIRRVNIISYLYIAIAVSGYAMAILYFWNFTDDILPSVFQSNGRVLAFLAASQILLAIIAPITQTLIMTLRSNVVIKVNLLAAASFSIMILQLNYEINAEMMAISVLFAVLVKVLSTWLLYQKKEKLK